ncbi:ABC transporter ATP-binding protein [Mycoplasma sp. CSL10137]|uniref:ATP-binding cassette domain-containing protein n=1 Tax=unclassified Mycoplasma TaxID=2683645 RepID=UPI00197C1C5D|nr:MULTISPECIES: ABC transporter ATP-binding protein [unclassified Mycoplasma]MBN4083422.1 ABC transporter ATP-binding protein [Mycoplasma sp. CSL10137]MBN4084275.1 ABC transporter ATP-binding protein [Mycoplasma sp. CSL10166]MBU4692733.1 ABC transporter ATP-binding protein [Mycoplasma sp. CSL7491-lung]
MIEFQNINLNYGNKKIISNINLTFESNKVYGVIGKSGSGKSTLLYSFFDWSIINSGIFKINSNNKNSMTKKEVAIFKKSISLLEANNNFIETITFFENILLSYKHYKNYFYKFLKVLTRNQKDTLFNLLKEFGMEEYAFVKISDLSTGQKQRLAYISAIFNVPSILLCDEPTSNLDKLNTNLIYESIQKNKENRITIISLHDLDSAINFCDNIIAIRDGRIEKIFSKEMFDKEKLMGYFDTKTI